MRNPNYKYEENINPSTGERSWYVQGLNGAEAWGKTKSAARSRLLRQLKRFQAEQAEKGGTNDQS